MRRLVPIAVLLGVGFAAHAQVQFEGYYRIEKNRQHVGYFIQRLSLDPKTRLKTLSTYLRTKRGEADFFESTQAVESAEFRPRSSVFVTSRDAVPHQILTGFGQGLVRAKTTTYPANVFMRESHDRAPGVLGAFLFLATDFDHLKPKTAYTFRAYAEDRGRVALGSLNWLDTRTVGDTRVLQVVTEYLGQAIESFVDPRGIPLGSRLFAEQTLCFYVPTAKRATEDMPFPRAEIARRFGGRVPEGTPDTWSAVKDAETLMQTFAAPPPPGRRTAGFASPPALPLRSK